MKLFNINVTNRKRLAELGRDFIEVFAVSGFALAQPIYAVMSKNSEFFTAHHFFKLDFINLVLALGLAAPLAALAVELAVGLALGFFARKLVHLGILFLGLCLVLLPVLDKIFPSSVILPALASAAVAGAAVLAYCASPSLRSSLSLLAAGSLIFPLYFLFLTPIQSLFFNNTSFPSVTFQSETSPPVFFIIFDEFNATPLLNAQREIDAVRYPNFAALAKDAKWFPKASSVSSATILAVPAALTGIKPDQKRPPSITEHPNNLFTMLAGKYRMNVMEPYTSLFPQRLPNDSAETESALTKLQTSLADLKVVYKHIVYPQPLRAKLPSITHTFKGFAGGNSDPDVVGGIKKSAVYDRDERPAQIRKFIQNIRKSKEPSLNFLHVLLPHHFHDYTPSGQFYCPAQLMDGQLLPANAWNDNQELADLSYQRFMLQLGFTDRLVGEVIAKIKAEGLYDDSLIVLVADHGISFRAGQPIRPLVDGNFPDILNVPLFIKLPHQKAGEKDLRFAETTDIIPTVVDAIGAKVGWKLDGQSLLSGQLPERKVKHVYDLDTNVWKDYAYEAITAYPLLNQWIEKFGCNAPLVDLHKISPFEALVGQPLQSLDVQGVKGFFPEIQQWALFQKEIDPAAEFIPLYISGKVKVPPSLPPPYDLAVCINGTVRCVTRAYLSGSYENSFKTVLPQAALRKGKNEISVALVQRGPDAKLRLLTGELGAPSAPYALCDIDTPRPVIRTSGGENFPIVRGRLMGAFEPFKADASFIPAIGWAVSAPLKKPAKKVIVFCDSQYLATLDINVEREDIKKWLGPEYLLCGFRAELPAAPMLGREIRAYGIAPDGKASELDLYRAPGSKPNSDFERFVYYGAARLESAADGRPVVALSDGRKFEAPAGKHQGALEKIEVAGEFVHCAGWAATGGPHVLPKAILFFQNGKLAAVRRTNTLRPDLASRLKLDKALECGFDYNIAKSNFEPLPGNPGKALRVVAVFHDDTLCELN